MYETLLMFSYWEPRKQLLIYFIFFLIFSSNGLSMCRYIVSLQLSVWIFLWFVFKTDLSINTIFCSAFHSFSFLLVIYILVYTQEFEDVFKG